MRLQPGGSLAARRAVVRWAWRMFRREWRQQVLVLALLTVAVAVAVGGTSAAYNVVPLRSAEFGTAQQRIDLDGTDPGALDAELALAEEHLGAVDVITHHRPEQVPGSSDTLDVRGQDPDGPYGAPMLRLRAGRYPTGPDEVAVTDGAADALGLALGASHPLGAHDRTVVGLVENPSDLSDEFALVSPTDADAPESASLLVSASDEQLASFEDAVGGERDIADRGETERATAAAVALGVTTVVLLIVSLVAAAGFVVVAQRRLRQLGMLAAIGATDKHLRLVMVADGVAVGLSAAVTGTAIGLAVWMVLAPQLESVAQHRIDRLGLPWGAIGAGAALAIVTAAAAAWWPARAVTRIPITAALSARPPRPRTARRSAALGGLLLAIGIGCLAGSDPGEALPLITGTIATTLGVVLVCPLAIRALAIGAARVPIAGRLALRDLARYQARSGAALAAVTLGVGIPVAIVIGTAAAEHTADEGNLSERQLLVRIGDGPDRYVVPQRSPDELENLEAEVGRIGALVDETALVPLEMAVDPTVDPERGPGGDDVRPAVMLEEPVGGTAHARELYVATPELLAYHGLDAIDPAGDVLAAPRQRLWPKDDRRPTGALRLQPPYGQPLDTEVRTVDVDEWTSGPIAMVTPQAVQRNGWQPAQVGWLVEAAQPLTGAQIADARDIAAGAGLAVEVRDEQATLSVVRSGATAAGLLIALGILSLTVGLLRSEAGGELRTLTATGANRSIRRSITSVTAGALALLGVLLSTVTVYVALSAGHLGNVGTLSRVPFLHLTVMAVGIPVGAAVAGWAVAGREPDHLGRAHDGMAS